MSRPASHPAELGPLAGLGLGALERLYREAPLGPPPSGMFHGSMLARLETVGARRPLVRLVDRVAFDLTPYGIDFERRHWWFGHPRLALGHFGLRAGRSRWRDTAVFTLEYDASRLPRVLRALLYDEVKPLDHRLCLGLGGINREAGEGDHFFFALTRS